MKQASLAQTKLRLAMLAGTALLAMAPAAQAVVVTTFANTTVAIPATVDGVYLNLLTGARGAAGAGVSGWDINPYLQNNVFTFFWANAAAGTSGGVASAVTGGTYTNLPLGSVVSSASIFSASSGGGGPGSTINFQSAGTHTLGFRFFNEATSATHYGYMTIQNGANAGFPAAITGWVYENTGAAITVVPEPATYALMALGLAAVGGIAARRRKV